MSDSGESGSVDEDVEDDESGSFVKDEGVGPSESDLGDDNCCQPVCCEAIACTETEDKGSKKGKTLQDLCKPPKIRSMPDMQEPSKSDKNGCCDYSYYYNLGYSSGFNDSNSKNREYVQQTNDYSYTTGFNAGFNTSNCMNQEYNEESSKYWYEYGYNAGFNSSNCENQEYTEASNKCHYEAGYNNGWNDSNCVNDSYVDEATDYYYREGYNTGVNEANAANDCYTDQVSHYYYEVGYNDGFDNCRCKWEETQQCCCPPNPCCCPTNSCCCPRPANPCCPRPATCDPCCSYGNRSCCGPPSCCSPCCPHPCSASPGRSSNAGSSQLGGRPGEEKQGEDLGKNKGRPTKRSIRQDAQPEDLYNNNFSIDDEMLHDDFDRENKPACCCCCGKINKGNEFDWTDKEVCIEFKSDEPVQEKRKSSTEDLDFKNITIVCENPVTAKNTRKSEESESDDEECTPTGYWYPCYNRNGCTGHIDCLGVRYGSCAAGSVSWYFQPVLLPQRKSQTKPETSDKTQATVQSTGTNYSEHDVQSEDAHSEEVPVRALRKEREQAQPENLPKPFVLWPPGLPAGIFCEAAKENDKNFSKRNENDHGESENQGDSHNENRHFKMFIPYQLLQRTSTVPAVRDNPCCSCPRHFSQTTEILDVIECIKQQAFLAAQPEVKVTSTVSPSPQKENQRIKSDTKTKEDRKSKDRLKSQILKLESQIEELDEMLQDLQNQMCDAKLQKRTAKENICRMLRLISAEVAENYSTKQCVTSTALCAADCTCGPELPSEDLSKYRNCDPDWRSKIQSKDRKKSPKSNKLAKAKGDIASQYCDMIKQLEETITKADEEHFQSLSEFRKLCAEKEKLERKLTKLRPSQPAIVYGEYIEQCGRTYKVLY